MPQSFPQKPQRGFALIEVLVSVLLFSLGLLGFIDLQARAISISSDAQDRNRASLLANEIASAMWISGSTAVDDAVLSSWIDKVRSPPDGGLPDGEGKVTSSEKFAAITITWTAPARSKSDASSRFTTTVVMP